MPEVCEVALTAQILHQKLRKNIISDVEILGGRYSKKTFEGYEEMIQSLPLKIRKIDSVGKFLWFEFYGKKYLMNTFGLTGMWGFSKIENAALKIKTNKHDIWFSDVRRFGTIQFTSDVKKIKDKILSLQPDLLKTDDFDLSLVKKSKQKIIKILMDQKKIGSGIGNYLAAEILYRAKISPHRIGNSLSDEDLERLKYYIKYVIKLCYLDNHTGYMVNLKDHLNNVERLDYHSDIILKESTFKFRVYGKKLDPKGNEVIADKIIANRSTYWVPAVQK